MPLSITQAGVQEMVEGQLKSACITCLSLAPLVDFNYRGVIIPVYWGTFCEADNIAVYDAWIVISEFPVNGEYVIDTCFYNAANFDTVEQAVAQHIGTLALEGKLTLVDGGYARTS